MHVRTLEHGSRCVEGSSFVSRDLSVASKVYPNGVQGGLPCSE